MCAFAVVPSGICFSACLFVCVFECCVCVRACKSVVRWFMGACVFCLGLSLFALV